MARQQLILDRYRVIDQVGAGGYGTVQHAYDTRLKRDVAIKRIALSEVDVARARLLAMEERMRVEGALAEEEDLSCAQDTASAFGEQEDDGELGGGTRVRDAAVASSPTRVVDIVRAEPLPWEDDVDFPEDPAFLDAREGAFRPLSPLGSTKSPSRSALPKSEEKPARAMPAASGATAEAEVADIDDDALFDHIPGLEEARTAAHLNDANIVTVYDCEVHGDAAYVVMEYVEGKTLSRVLRELGDDISLDVIAAVFASVSHALEVAHDSDVLHLDIKPENVIINKKGVVKVTDFGLATLMDASGCATTGGGTIGYMPPEQMRQERLDVRTDEWALASLTYEMMSGSNPFLADDIEEAESLIEEAELLKILELVYLGVRLPVDIHLRNREMVLSGKMAVDLAV